MKNNQNDPALEKITSIEFDSSQVAPKTSMDVEDNTEESQKIIQQLKDGENKNPLSKSKDEEDSSDGFEIKSGS